MAVDQSFPLVRLITERAVIKGAMISPHHCGGGKGRRVGSACASLVSRSVRRDSAVRQFASCHVLVKTDDHHDVVEVLSRRTKRRYSSQSGRTYRRSAVTSQCAQASSSIERIEFHKDPGRRYLSSSSSTATGQSRSSSTAKSTPDFENDVGASNKISDSSTATSTQAYLDLAKAKLSALVVTTTGAGFIAAGSPIISTQLDVLSACLIGTALCSSSAAALNQIFERNRDAKMKRTQQRPLVMHTLTVPQATAAATLWGISGTSLLYFGTNPITASLGLFNILLYSGLYTYMKPKSIYNTWVGALVGAIPPVMGWTAAAIDPTLPSMAVNLAALDWQQPVALASTLYLWQMPHFFALSFMHRIDYKRGGFQMVPCLEQDGVQTSKLIVNYTWYLSTVPIITTLADMTSSMFALEGITLNSYALYVAYRFRQERTNANARKVFLTSLWYLPTFMMLYLLHSKVWDEEMDEATAEVRNRDAIAKTLSDTIHSLRDAGREFCVHEVVVHKANESGDENISDDHETSKKATAAACPVSLVTRKSLQASGDQVVAAASDAAVVAVTTAATSKSRAEEA